MPKRTKADFEAAYRQMFPRAKLQTADKFAKALQRQRRVDENKINEHSGDNRSLKEVRQTATHMKNLMKAANRRKRLGLTD